MTDSVAKLSSEIQNLSSTLLSTLDESIFFTELSKFLSENVVVAEKMVIYRILDDFSAVLISKDNKPVHDNFTLKKGEGIVGHVTRTKRAYFSNHVDRDPLFSNEAKEGVKAELCVPVLNDNSVVATIHFKAINDEKEFSRDDITSILSVCSELQKPIANIKMYLAAKSLNEALLIKIEQKEKELEEKNRGLEISDSYKIKENKIISRSETMKSILILCDKISATEANLVITGDSGSGKEMLARRIHCRGSRKDNAFAVVDCGSLTELQLEEELFGKENDDFMTGHTIKDGRLEVANGGTLFLNEISTLTPNMQMKLLHFIKDGLGFRVGGKVPFRSDVRIISTTTKDMLRNVEEGSFREDLFYALNTTSILIPALQGRKEDIEALAIYFLNESCMNGVQKSFAPCAMNSLIAYNWPGNVRELHSIVERAYILADGMIIEKDHLADKVVNNDLPQNYEQDETEEEEVNFFEMTLNELEKRHICMTLEHLEGNKTKTAKMLGITVKTLYNKLHSYGMIEVKEA